MENKSAEEMEASTEKLLKDLKAVVRDGEELLRAGARHLGERGHAARERLASALEVAKDTQRRLQERAVSGAKATDRAVHDYPYYAAGIAFGIGVLVGNLDQSTAVMVGNNHKPPGLSALLGRFGSTALRAVNTRVELLTVEWQEERLRLRDVLVWAAALLFLGTLGGLLLTATIIFLFPEHLRIYVTGALALLYLCGAAGAWFAIKAALKRVPFSESIEQVKKDRAWLESLK